MSLLPLFEALGRTAPGQFLRDSTLAFALTEAAHLLALTLIGGVVSVVGLASAGLFLPAGGAPSFGRALRPLFIGALALVVLSGALLVAAGPYKYYTNPVFWSKLALLLGAVAGYAALDRRLAAAPAPLGLGWRGAALLLIGLWLAVAIAGRLIGLI